MIISNAQDIRFNGSSVQAVVVNGNVVWPVGTRYNCSVTNISGIPMGLTAVNGYGTAYSLSNYTGNFDVILPSGTVLYISASTPLFKRPDIQGASFLGYNNRSTGVLGVYPATAYATARVVNDTNITLDVVNNAFYYSGIFNSGRYDKWSDEYSFSFSTPAQLTAMTPSMPWGSAYNMYVGRTSLTGSVKSSSAVSVKCMPTGVRYSAVSAKFNLSAYAYQGNNSITGTANIHLNLGSLCLSSRRTLQGRTGERINIISSTMKSSTAIFENTGSTWSSANYFGSRMACMSNSIMTGTIYSGDWTMSGLLP